MVQVAEAQTIIEQMDAPIQPHSPIAPPSQTSGLAISSLVLGILSFFIFGITAIPGVVCGHLSLRRIRTSHGRLVGGGLAVAGLVLGYVALALWLVIALSLVLSYQHTLNQYDQILKSL